MSDTFNPYSQWLGLAADNRQPNHYELLSLPPGESDPKKISLAAEQAATKIRSFRPGPHAADWARLLDEVQAARLALLDPVRKAEYDRKFSITSKAPPSPDSRSATQPSPLADLFPPGFRPGARGQEAGDRRQETVAPLTTHPAPLTAAAEEDPANTLPPAAQTMPALPPAATTGAYPSALPNPAAMHPAYPTAMAPYAAMPIDPMAPVAIAGVTGPASGTNHHSPLTTHYTPVPGMPTPVPMGQPVVPQAAYPMAAAVPVAAPVPTAAPVPVAVPLSAAPPADALPASEAPGVRKASAAAVMLAARKERQTRKAALLAGGAAGLVIVAGLAAYAVINGNFGQPSYRDVAQADTKDTASGGHTKADRAAEIRATPVNVPTVKPKTTDVDTSPPRPMPAPMQVVERPTLPEPMPQPAPPPMPEPTPEPPAPTPMPMPSPKPTKEQVAQLEAALKKSRLALSEQSFDEAEAEAVKAEKVAVLPEHQALVERLRLAIDHMRLFQPALAEAAGKLEAAETIKVGSSTVVAIVETFPDKIIVRVNGMNRTYSFANIPPGLAAAILDTKRIGGEPDSRILKAMFVATAKDVDADALADARGWLQEVQASDPNAAALLMFLDDTYDGLVAAFEADEKNAAANSAAAGPAN